MAAEQMKDYEFEERAAIREYDGDLPEGTANFFARQELDARKAQDGIRKRKRDAAGAKENKITEAADGPAKTAKEQIATLQEKRDRVGKEMRALKKSPCKDELFGEWMELCGQIIELRKEPKK